MSSLGKNFLVKHEMSSPVIFHTVTFPTLIVRMYSTVLTLPLPYIVRDTVLLKKKRFFFKLLLFTKYKIMLNLPVCVCILSLLHYLLTQTLWWKETLTITASPGYAVSSPKGNELLVGGIKFILCMSIKCK